LEEVVSDDMGGCHDCTYHHSFKARDDERERYGFGETGYGCKHPIDGGVYVLDPSKPSCLRGPVVRP
jgi:hypothetical protein